MGRKNHAHSRRQQRRVAPGGVLPRALRFTQGSPPGAATKMVLPTGRCYFRSKAGKLIFKTEALAQQALRQAKQKRKYQATGHVECRYYPCPPGGCGGYHLTSRETYEDRSKAS